LIAPEEAHGWGYATKENGRAKKQYGYTVRFCVQLVLDAEGHSWTWPPSVDPWTFGLPRDLMGTMPTVEQNRRQYSQKQKHVADLSLVDNNPTMQRIDPLFKAGSCFKPF
jgi:hypothetical protein